MANRVAAERVYDRLSKDLPINAKVAPLMVKDEAGDNILVFRSLRDDPLGAMHSRGQVDEAQYAAGRHWQRCYEAVEISGARAIDPSKEAVDGGRLPEMLTDQYSKAYADLIRAGRELKLIGESVIRDVLGRGMILLHAAAARGLTTEYELLKFGREFRGYLETLAVVFGYAAKPKS